MGGWVLVVWLMRRDSREKCGQWEGFEGLGSWGKLTVRGSSRTDRGRVEIVRTQKLDRRASKARDVVGQSGRHHDLGHVFAGRLSVRVDEKGHEGRRWKSDSNKAKWPSGSACGI